MRIHKNNQHLGWMFFKYLMDKVLFKGDFLSLRNLETALMHQKETDEQLLETLVRMGTLTPYDIEKALTGQNEGISLNNSIKSAGRRELLGQLLLITKRITPGQLDEALREQSHTKKKLGDILVRSGLLRKNELIAVLTFQRHLDKGTLSNHFRLGEILIDEGHITRQQIEDALAHQKISHKKIGEILIEEGHLKKHQLDNGLKLQQKLISTALMVLLSLVNITDVEEAYT